MPRSLQLRGPPSAHSKISKPYPSIKPTNADMATMKALPIEITTQVFSYLEFHDVRNISLVNKHIRSHSARLLFRDIRLRLKPSDELATVIAECKQVIDEYTDLSSVQHVFVMPTQFDNAAEVMDLYAQQNGTLKTDDHGTRPIEPWKYSRPKFELSYLDTQWQALADFINDDLLALKDLTWACREQIPLNVLRALSSRDRTCRLHMRSFSLPSLQAGDTLNLQDLEVATSPCLHSISLITAHQRRASKTLPIVAVLHQMVAGAAPNLKELNHSWHEEIRDWYLVSRSYAEGTDGFVAFPDSSSSKGFNMFLDGDGGKLTSLALEGGVAPDQVHPLAIWARYTDFRAIESLKLYTSNSTDLYTHYDSAGQKLSNLKKLAYSALDTRTLYNPTFFILTLPPLVELELHDWNELDLQGICLNKILRHCGPSLRRLYCPDIVVQNTAQKQLRTICRRLKVMEFQSDRIRPYRRTSAMQHSELTRTHSPPGNSLWPGARGR